MYRYFISIILAIFFVGCALKPTPNTKLDQDEKLYLLLAYDAKNRHKFEKSYEYFWKLYTKKEDKIYLYEALDSLLMAKKYGEVEKQIKKLSFKNNAKLLSLLIEAYKYNKKYKEAKEYIGLLLKISKDEKSYLLAGDIYFLTKEYDKSIKFYKKAYEHNQSPMTIIKISEILYSFQHKPQEAIKEYESYITFQGCSHLVCQRLATIYAKKGNIKGVIEVYKKLYFYTKDSVVGKKVIDLYLLKKDNIGLEEFLQKSKLNDEMLFGVLKYNKKYEAAAKLAFVLFKRTQKIDYLAEYSILNFEKAKKKNKALIKETIKNLKKVITKNNYHLYLNYLGYLLIDYNIDVKEGIKYVKEALKQDRDNYSYIDSLAWGYYKLKKYKKAYKVMKKLKSSLHLDPILKEHFNKIVKKYKKRKNDTR